MKIHISKQYLRFPVDKNSPVIKLHLYVDGSKIQEIDIRLGKSHIDFYTYMEVQDYLDQDIEIRTDAPQEQLSGISCQEKKTENLYLYRPKLHFTPELGWHNDPNGLVYADGVYHLYYQWNPYGVEWGNMHWGHAVSRDLLTWEHRPVAMAPDQYGTVFSGCGFADLNNAAGYGADALLFFYTAAGGTNQWSKELGHLFSQRLAVSADGGTTMQCIDTPVIEHIARENRDPKVFYHERSHAYIMLLYLDGYEFSVFRSEDLLCWEETQRFSREGMWECPDLFELSVKDSREKKWVFWSADGYYLIGDFDGYRFTPESERLCAYATGLPYAAQTFAGVRDRVISVAWLRLEQDSGNYRGAMSLPSELFLVKQADGYRIAFRPVRELFGKRQCGIPADDEPREILISWRAGNRGQISLWIGSTRFLVDFDREIMEISNEKTEADVAKIPFHRSQPLSLDIIVDQEVIEFYGNDGVLYGAVETEENVLSRKIQLSGEAVPESYSIVRLSDIL